MAETLRPAEYTQEQVDSIIQSAIVNSFGVGQGNEAGQRLAMRILCGRNQILAQQILRRLEANADDLVEKTKDRAQRFANSKHHPRRKFVLRDESTPERYIFRTLKVDAADPTAATNLGFDAHILGLYMVLQDARLLAGPEGRGKPEGNSYTLYTANFNSHMLHYAYLQDPAKIPEDSVQMAAAIGARNLTLAIETGNIETLQALEMTQGFMDSIAYAVGVHLEHYPHHQAYIPSAFLDNLNNPDVRAQLPAREWTMTDHYRYFYVGAPQTVAA